MDCFCSINMYQIIVTAMWKFWLSHWIGVLSKKRECQEMIVILADHWKLSNGWSANWLDSLPNLYGIDDRMFCSPKNGLDFCPFIKKYDKNTNKIIHWPLQLDWDARGSPIMCDWLTGRKCSAGSLRTENVLSKYAIIVGCCNELEWCFW